jgi:hypothetical protein
MFGTLRSNVFRYSSIAFDKCLRARLTNISFKPLFINGVELPFSKWLRVFFGIAHQIP